MFEIPIQDALAGAWDSTVSKVLGFIPDWLVWLVTTPIEFWGFFAVGIAMGFVYGKWGIGALGVLFSALIFVFTLGRKSKK